MERNDSQDGATNTGTPAGEFSGSGTRPIDSFDFSGTTGMTGGEADAGGAQFAGATTAGSVPLTGDGRLAQIGDKLGSGLEAAQNLIKDVDIDGIKSGIERQVKEHPGRTLLIAAGLGYLIGRAFRNK